MGSKSDYGPPSEFSCKSDFEPKSNCDPKSWFDPKSDAGLIPNQIYIPEQILVRHQTSIQTEILLPNGGWVLHDKTSCLVLSVIIQHQKHKPPNDTRLLEYTLTGHDFSPSAIPSPNFCFDIASVRTKNSIPDIVQQLGRNTENLDRYTGAGLT